MGLSSGWNGGSLITVIFFAAHISSTSDLWFSRNSRAFIQRSSLVSPEAGLFLEALTRGCHAMPFLVNHASSSALVASERGTSAPCKCHVRTLWCQLEDMFQLIVTPQGIEKVMIQLKDTPTKVYAIGARLFLSKVPLEVLQNWVLIQLIVTPHILGKVQGQI